jgi:hypothetical protein
MSILPEDYVSLFFEGTGEMREDLRLSEENDDDKDLAERIKSALEAEKSVYVSVLNSMGIEKIIEMQIK